MTSYPANDPSSNNTADASGAPTLTVGTRGSQLARAQTQWVIDRITEAHPSLTVTMEIITTTGDRQSGRPLPEIGGKGLFTLELEQALHEKRIDLAVHSAKDLPTELADGLAVLAYPAREDPRDGWVSADGVRFEDLPAGATVGTSSLRRQAQLLRHRSDLQFIALRGNVDTRIRKVHRGDCHGAVLAMAGLKRVGLIEKLTHPFEPDLMLPAPGQGALALEARVDDARVGALLQAVHDPATATEVQCERAILAELDAGCRAPVGIHVKVEGETLVGRALVIQPDGQLAIEVDAREPVGGEAAFAAHLVAELRQQGADAIIAACRPEPS